MKEDKFVPVDTQKFKAFALWARSKGFEQDVCGIGEPPLLTINDFSLGIWPDSIVAQAILYSVFREADKCSIREDYLDIFEEQRAVTKQA